MSEAALVENLPEGVWELIVNALLHQARGNPGDVFRLSLTNHALRSLISQLEVWRFFSEQLGWLVPSNNSGRSGTAGLFLHFQQRMQARWRVRQAVRQLSGFLQGGCFASGASIDLLFAAEQRLGAPLPWQVWELFRFRNGQLRKDVLLARGVPFANGGRLLSIAEAVVEEARFRELQLEVPDPEQHGPLRMLDAPSAPCVQAPGVAAPSGSRRQPWACLPLTEEFSLRRQYVCDRAGRIFLRIGLQMVRVADTLVDFIHSLLR